MFFSITFDDKIKNNHFSHHEDEYLYADTQHQLSRGEIGRMRWIDRTDEERLDGFATSAIFIR